MPVWSQIEVDIGILTACLPCLSPLLRLFFHSAHQQRTMTPSMVTLPRYAGGRSWGSVDSQESTDAKEKGEERRITEEASGGHNTKNEDGKAKGVVMFSEKELPPIPEESERSPTYYEDASDEEEAREVGIARQVGIARSTSKRIEYGRGMS